MPNKLRTFNTTCTYSGILFEPHRREPGGDDLRVGYCRSSCRSVWYGICALHSILQSICHAHDSLGITSSDHCMYLLLGIPLERTQDLSQYYADYHIYYKCTFKSTYSEPHLCQTSRIFFFQTHRYVQIHGRQVLIKSRYQIQERRMHHTRIKKWVEGKTQENRQIIMQFMHHGPSSR